MSDKLHGGVKAASTDVSIPVLLRATADNTEKTGVADTDVTASYWRQGSTRTAITPAALSAVGDGHSDGGWIAVDGTNMPGVYRFDIPDAAFATGADWVVIYVKVADSFGYQVQFNLETAGAAEVKAEIDNGTYGLAAIETLVDELESRLTALRATALDNLDATISSRSNHSAADVATSVWAAGTRTLSSFGTLVSDIWAAATRTITGGTVTTVSDKTGYALTSGERGSIADAVWDEAQSGHTTAGTFGKFLDTAVSGIGGATGSGADTVTLRVTRDGTSGGTAVPDADVWITTDAAGETVVAGTRQTDANGDVIFLLDAGSVYYFWAQKDGEVDIQGTQFTAVADS